MASASAKRPAAVALPLRHALARAIVLRGNDPRTALQVVEQLADRLEGRPIQTTELRPLRETIFYRRGDPLPPGVSPPPRPIAAPSTPATDEARARAEEEAPAADATISAAALETLTEPDETPRAPTAPWGNPGSR